MIVNRIMLISNKNIEFGMRISQMVPAKKLFTTQVEKYLAGTIEATTLIAGGIELIGNNKPPSIRAGRKPVTRAIWLAKN